MELNGLTFATWCLVGVSTVLPVATGVYAYYTKELCRGSKEQIEALMELTNAILQLPSIAKHLQAQEELVERREKEQEKIQKKALTG